jgi:hypothetical protein
MQHAGASMQASVSPSHAAWCRSLLLLLLQEGKFILEKANIVKVEVGRGTRRHLYRSTVHACACCSFMGR